jgi:hypothetical protein
VFDVLEPLFDGGQIWIWTFRGSLTRLLVRASCATWSGTGSDGFGTLVVVAKKGDARGGSD